MQAIESKILPCTNHRPTRIKASCFAGSITRQYPSQVFKRAAGTVDDSDRAAHYHIVKELMALYNWEEITWGNKAVHAMRWGQLANGHYVWCFGQSVMEHIK